MTVESVTFRETELTFGVKSSQIRLEVIVFVDLTPG